MHHRTSGCQPNTEAITRGLAANQANRVTACGSMTSRDRDTPFYRTNPVMRLRRFGTRALQCLSLLLGIGWAYETLNGYRDSGLYHPEGRLIDVGGHKMHVYGVGQGTVTVVFASGLRSPSAYVDFYPLHQVLGRRTRVVVYDRPGHGWSEPTQSRRNLDLMVDEIHTALELAGESAPYIFVAHSLGTLEALRYSQRFPGEVRGILAIDGGSPDYYAGIPPTLNTQTWLGYASLRFFGGARLALCHLGYLQSILEPQNGFRQVPKELLGEYRALLLRSLGSSNILDEAMRSQENARLVLSGANSTGAIVQQNFPLNVLTAERSIVGEAGWLESQKDFAKLSAKGTQSTVLHAGHSIHHYHPEAVLSAIDDLLHATEHLP